MSEAHSEQEKAMLGSERIKLLQNPAECWFNFPCCLRMASDCFPVAHIGALMTLPPFLGFLQKESSHAPQRFFALGEKSIQDLPHLIPFFVFIT